MPRPCQSFTSGLSVRSATLDGVNTGRAVLLDQIVLAVVQGGHGNVAQDIVERPEQRRGLRALQILLDRTDENRVQILRAGQRIAVRSGQLLPEIQNFLSQVGGRDRIFPRHDHRRRDHDDLILVVANQRVERDRAGIELPQDFLHAAGVLLQVANAFLRDAPVVLSDVYMLFRNCDHS